MSDLGGLLKATFGFADFRPGQAEAISSLISGAHTLVVMPTGAGKSLIYQLVAMTRPGVTLVISPLISLMQDQVASLERVRIPSTFINSSIPGPEQLERLDAIVEGRYRLVYITPERLRSSAFQDVLAKVKVSLLAVDEAHCISEWGHDFRPDYLHIAAARARVGSPLTAALTATATPKVRQDIARLLELDDVNYIVTGFNRPNLALDVRYCRDLQAKLHALLNAIRRLDGGAAIVYVGTRRDAEEVAGVITEVAQIPAAFYHAGLPSEAREKTQNEFMNGRTQIVVATNAFGMGIDRADVRLVAHYTMPGSLEAYYQEAGRAGRDGLPARAMLLYDPKDRSLQEWFIENSVLGVDDLCRLHTALGEGGWFSSEELSRDTGLHEVAVRVGLSLLESAGAAVMEKADGVRWQIRSSPLEQDGLHLAVAQARTRARARREQLDTMIAYAESSACRRRIILNYFGDPGAADAPWCCDNCNPPSVRKAGSTSPPQQREMGKGSSIAGADIDHSTVLSSAGKESLTPENKTALLILDTIRSIDWGIGRHKIIKLLGGSRSNELTRVGYDRNPRYGKLSVFRLDEIGGLVDQMIEMGYLKTVGGRRPVLRLTPIGEASLVSRAPIPLVFPRPVVRSKRERMRARELRPGDTVEITASMLDQGMTPGRIARERGLAEGTILAHIAKLIWAKRLTIDQVMSRDRADRIREAIARVGDISSLKPVKELLPDDVSYGEIECVMAADGISRVSNLPRPSDHRTSELSEPADPVAAYLSRSHPRPLSGPWNAGWALGFHSSFAGSDWRRSGVGEMTFRLKYRNDDSVLELLVDEALKVCREHPELLNVDAIVPVPPSSQHARDPVKLFCQALGRQLGRPVMDVLIRTRPTRPQKEMRTLAAKRANVAGAFAVRQRVDGGVLVIDDLYDSGATLVEVVAMLKSAGARSICVLTLTRTIHSDA